jgi:hypothetical protein
MFNEHCRKAVNRLLYKCVILQKKYNERSLLRFSIHQDRPPAFSEQK